VQDSSAITVVGAALVAGGVQAVIVHGLVAKVLIPALLAPLVAIAIAAAGTYLTYRVTAGISDRVRDRGFKLGQIGSASLLSLAHGTNDAQKTMGVITPSARAWWRSSRPRDSPPTAPRPQ
jgi:inorganic phosphate transporter, PiT family